MNCRDIAEFAPLYLSGELEDTQSAHFRAHVNGCRACQAEMEQQATLDEQLRAALFADLPDTSAVERSVRARISPRKWTRVAAAAAVIIAAAWGYWMLRPQSPAKLYADAASDHRVEVMEHKPRHWRTDPTEIAKLSARFGITTLDLAPPAITWSKLKCAA